MTREKALIILNECRLGGFARTLYTKEEYCTARDMAIRALEEHETVTEFADRCRECGAKYGKLLKQKSGVWIEIDDEPHEVWECDHCGFVIDGSGCIEPYEYRDIYKYCPNCGAKMLENEDK